jgi:hypothetical protein
MERDVTGGIFYPLDVVPSSSPLDSSRSSPSVLCMPRAPQPVDSLGDAAGSGMSAFGRLHSQTVSSPGNLTVSFESGDLCDVLPVRPVCPRVDSPGVSPDRSVDPQVVTYLPSLTAVTSVPLGLVGPLAVPSLGPTPWPLLLPALPRHDPVCQKLPAFFDEPLPDFLRVGVAPAPDHRFSPGTMGASSGHTPPSCASGSHDAGLTLTGVVASPVSCTSGSAPDDGSLSPRKRPRRPRGGPADDFEDHSCPSPAASVGGGDTPPCDHTGDILEHVSQRGRNVAAKHTEYTSPAQPTTDQKEARDSRRAHPQESYQRAARTKHPDDNSHTSGRLCTDTRRDTMPRERSGENRTSGSRQSSQVGGGANYNAQGDYRTRSSDGYRPRRQEGTCHPEWRRSHGQEPEPRHRSEKIEHVRSSSITGDVVCHDAELSRVRGQERRKCTSTSNAGERRHSSWEGSKRRESGEEYAPVRCVATNIDHGESGRSPGTKGVTWRPQPSRDTDAAGSPMAGSIPSHSGRGGDDLGTRKTTGIGMGEHPFGVNRHPDAPKIKCGRATLSLTDPALEPGMGRMGAAVQDETRPNHSGGNARRLLTPETRVPRRPTEQTHDRPPDPSRTTHGSAQMARPPEAGPDMKEADATADPIESVASSSDTEIGLGQLLRVEDACVTVYRSLRADKRAKVDRAILRLARCGSTMAPMARFLQGALARNRKRSGISRPRYERARVAILCLWGGRTIDDVPDSMILAELRSLLERVVKDSPDLAPDTGTGSTSAPHLRPPPAPPDPGDSEEQGPQAEDMTCPTPSAEAILQELWRYAGTDCRDRAHEQHDSFLAALDADICKSVVVCPDANLIVNVLRATKLPSLMGAENRDAVVRLLRERCPYGTIRELAAVGADCMKRVMASFLARPSGARASAASDDDDSQSQSDPRPLAHEPAAVVNPAPSSPPATNRACLPPGWGHTLRPDAAVRTAITVKPETQRTAAPSYTSSAGTNCARGIPPPPSPPPDEPDSSLDPPSPRSPKFEPADEDVLLVWGATYGMGETHVTLTHDQTAKWGDCLRRLQNGTVHPLAAPCPMPASTREAPEYVRTLLTFTTSSIDPYFWKWAQACLLRAAIADRALLKISSAYSASHIALGDGFVMVARMGRDLTNNLPYSYGSLCYAPNLHPSWTDFLPDPTTSRVIMLRLALLVVSRVRECSTHEMLHNLNVRVSRTPCENVHGSDSSPELVSLHGQCVAVDLIPLATYRCNERHAAQVFKAFLQGGVHSQIRSDVVDDMRGISLHTIPSHALNGRGSTTVNFCPDLIARAKRFRAPIQRMQFLRRASAAIRGAGAPPAALVDIPDLLQHALCAPSSLLRRVAHSALVESYFEPESTMNTRITELSNAHPTAHSAYVEPSGVLNQYYSEVDATCRRRFPLDVYDHGNWCNWYSESGGVCHTLNLSHRKK